MASTLASLVKHIKNAETDPLTVLIDEYLLKRDASPNRYTEHTVPMVGHPRKPGRISPSSVCGCHRMAQFQFLGMPTQRKIDPDTELIFESGNWGHHKWQAIFYDMEAVLGADRFKVERIEYPVRIPDLFVAGTLDVIVRIDGKLWVIEIKTINDWGFTEVNYSGPKWEHVRQVATYCRSTKIKRAIVFYENRNNSHFKAFTVDLLGVAWDEVENWVRKTLDYMVRRRLAPKHPNCDRGTFLYDKCPYSQYCYSEMSRAKVKEIAFRNFKDLDTAWDNAHEDVQ